MKIFAANGTRVKKGDSILVLEAMKMEVMSYFVLQKFFCKSRASSDFEA